MQSADPKPKKQNFGLLLKEIIRAGYCSGCGACFSICPMDNIGFENFNPKLEAACIACGACSDVCFRFQSRKKPLTMSELLGNILAVYKGHTTLNEVLPIAQNGGVVTTLLLSALRKKVIDAALVTGEGEDKLHPKPTLATTEEEILDAGGSKYTISSTLKILKSIKQSNKNEVAVVGLPCHMSTLTNMMEKEYLSLEERVKYKIGLFCMHSYGYDEFTQYLEKELNLQPGDITKMEISKGKFILETKDNATHKIKLSNLSSADAVGCHYCYDFAAEDADIAVGNVGVDSKNNVIIVRTEKGQDLLDLAMELGNLDVQKIDQSEWEKILGLGKKLNEKKRKESKRLPPLEP